MLKIKKLFNYIYFLLVFVLLIPQQETASDDGEFEFDFYENEDFLSVNLVESRVKRVVASETTSSGMPEESTTTSSSTTEATTTTSSSLLYYGSNEVSIKSNVLSSSTSSLGYSVSLDDSITIPFVTTEYSSLNVFKNGFIILGEQGASFVRAVPRENLESYSVALIAPFWTDMAIDSISDVTVSTYNPQQLSSEQTLVNQVTTDIKNYLNDDQSTFTPNHVVIVTWKNMLPSVGSTLRASFQILFVQNYESSKTYALFNYDRETLTWSDSTNKPTLIGYTDGEQAYEAGISLYSNTEDTTIDPTEIFYANGNTGSIGRFVYDVSATTIDACTSWYLQASVNSKYDALTSAITTNKEYNCPNSKQITYSPFYENAETDSWQENVTCYKVSKIFSSKFQQITCCYDSETGEFIDGDSDAGYMYDESDAAIVANGRQLCCSTDEWEKCSNFYLIFPVSQFKYELNSLGRSSCRASGFGDPHIRSFDGANYLFNGYGEYIFAKTDDGTFELQAKSFVYLNELTPNVKGTFFVSFSARSSDSPIIEIKINGAYSSNPYLKLYVNKILESSFENNLEYSKSFYASSTAVVKVEQDATGAKVVFSNGVSYTIVITTTSITTTSKVSWLIADLNLADTFTNKYEGKMIGLAGNLNGNSGDDIFSRTNAVPVNSSEIAIFDIAFDWLLLDNEESLFVNDTSYGTRVEHKAFRPTFFDSIQVDPELALVCNYSTTCMADAYFTGLTAVGLNSAEKYKNEQLATQVLKNQAPIIKFQQTVTKLDWSVASAVEIIATVFDADDGDLVTITVSVRNASTYTISGLSAIPVKNASLKITYTPMRNEYPRIRVKAVDSDSMATKNSVKFEICDCKSLDSENKCVYGTTQEVINSNIRKVKCDCLKYYTGDYCNSLNDYCGISKPCSPISSDYNISYTCSNFDVATQKATNKTYYCDGACPNLIGYTKGITGFCFDINECLSSTACPSNATCINSIGSFTCKCPAGTHYANNLCNDIDECATNSNDCEQLCQNTIGSYTCSCYAGYSLVNSTKCFYDPSIVIPGCNTKNCSQICTLDSSSNATVCKCNNEYGLDSDNATCADNNECALNTSGCSNTCVNTVGLFVCSCPTGQRLDIDKKTCIRCQSGTWGDNCNNTCNCVNALRCDSALGCICLTGYTGTFCQTDINECLNAPTFSQSTCVNTPGSFSYVCNSGYQKSSNTSNNNCYDINECLKTGICPSNKLCENTIGSYNCICQTGYRLNSTDASCFDIDECAQSPCSLNETCTNTEASYLCACKQNYKRIDNKCIYQERNSNMINYIIKFNNPTEFSSGSEQFNCSNVNEETIGRIINAAVIQLYSSQNISLNSSSTTKLSCDENGALITLVSTVFTNKLSPLEETAATIVMLQLKLNYESVFLYTTYGKAIQVTQSHVCIIYDAYNMCINDGVCYIANNQPSCLCLSNTTYLTGYGGIYCENPLGRVDPIISSALSNRTPMVLQSIAILLVFFIS